MQYLQLFFLAAIGAYFGYTLGNYAAGFAEMCFGEKLRSAHTRQLKIIVRWGVFAFILLGALSLAVH